MYRRNAWVLAALAVSGCAAPRAKPPGPLRIAVPYAVSTLDPHAEDTLGNFAVLVNLYEPLVTTDAEMRIRPCLATAWESPDPQTWILHLRPGVTFHSGRRLRAADVVYSLDRLRRSPRLEVRTYVQGVAEVTATDDLTVRIRTALPSTVFLKKLSFVMIVPEGASDGFLQRSTDGTGPYVLAGREPGEIRLDRNERYWGSAPALGKAAFRLDLDAEETLRGLRAGEYGIALCNSRKLEAGPGLPGRYDTVRADSLFVAYLGWDLSRRKTPFCGVVPNPFRDVRVRRAIALAIDQQKLRAGLPGYSVSATQLVPRFVFGFDPGIAEGAHDAEEARRLLREAGLAGGFEAVLHARPVLEEAARLVQDDLAGVGVKIEVRVLSNTDFFALKRQGVTLWLDRWACTSGDASDFLENFVHSPDAGRGLGAYNYGGYANAELDRAIERSAGIEQVDERQRVLQEAMAAVTGDLVLLPLYNDQDAYAIEKSLAWRPRSDRYVKVAEIGLRTP